MEDSSKDYTNGEIIITWEPKKCIHAGVCVKLLPKVYNPIARPWIKIQNASSEALMEQIDRCPSGALGYQKK